MYRKPLVYQDKSNLESHLNDQVSHTSYTKRTKETEIFINGHNGDMM